MYAKSNEIILKVIIMSDEVTNLDVTFEVSGLIISEMNIFTHE